MNPFKAIAQWTSASAPSDATSDLAPGPDRRLENPLDTIVNIESLNFHFGQGELRKQILFDIDLKLERGQIVILTGPSGSGKTTLLTLIGALRSVEEGTLQVLGKELRGLSHAQRVKVRRNIGFIFQAHNLFDSLTARQNVEMAIELRSGWGNKRSLSMEILSQLGLAERADYKPKHLSGGQKQRVAIARALVNKPQLILADEPTAALDKVTGREVVNLLKKLAREEGCTVLMVTHDNRILDVADRLVNLIDGRLESNQELNEFVTSQDIHTIDRKMFIL